MPNGISLQFKAPREKHEFAPFFHNQNRVGHARKRKTHTDSNRRAFVLFSEPRFPATALFILPNAYRIPVSDTKRVRQPALNSPWASLEGDHYGEQPKLRSR